jgi:hypothetical protein
MLLTYRLSAFEMVPVTTIIIIITTEICFHISRIYVNIVLVFALLCPSHIVYLFLFKFDFYWN